PAITSYGKRNERRTTAKGEGNDDDTHDRNTGRMAGSAARAAWCREGADAAQRRGGAPTSGATVGPGRQGLPFRDRRRERLAGRPLPGALAAPRLPLHVRARLHGGVSGVLRDRGWVRRLRGPPGEPRRHALGR